MRFDSASRLKQSAFLTGDAFCLISRDAESKGWSAERRRGKAPMDGRDSDNPGLEVRDRMSRTGRRFHISAEAKRVPYWGRVLFNKPRCGIEPTRRSEPRRGRGAWTTARFQRAIQSISIYSNERSSYAPRGEEAAWKECAGRCHSAGILLAGATDSSCQNLRELPN